MVDTEKLVVHYKGRPLNMVMVGGGAFLCVMALLRFLLSGSYPMAVLAGVAALVLLWFFYNMYSMAKDKTEILTADQEAVYSQVFPEEMGHKIMLRDISTVETAVSAGAPLLCITATDFEGLAQAVEFTQATRKVLDKYRDRGLGDFVLAAGCYDMELEQVAQELRRRVAAYKAQ